MAVRVEHLKIHTKGMDVFIPKSKTDQEAKEDIKPILRGRTHCPVQAVQEWLKKANITEGFVFRRFSPKLTSLKPSYNDPNKPDLAPRVVADIVKKYIERIGLNANEYSGHSLRSGFVTSAMLKGSPYEKIVEITKHKNYKSLMGYYRNVKFYENHAGEGLL